MSILYGPGTLLAVGYFTAFFSSIKADPPFDMYRKATDDTGLDFIFDTGSRPLMPRAPHLEHAESEHLVGLRPRAQENTRPRRPVDQVVRTVEPTPRRTAASTCRRHEMANRLPMRLGLRSIDCRTFPKPVAMTVLAAGGDRTRSPFRSCAHSTPEAFPHARFPPLTREQAVTSTSFFSVTESATAAGNLVVSDHTRR